LSALFQVDLEVIRMMRSEDFSFGFAEDVGKFVYLGETFEISGISTSCAELA